jgi:hypothetical protein
MKRHHKSLAAILSTLICCPVVAQTTSLETRIDIPYSSLEEALKDLQSKPGVEFRNEGGWTVAYDSVAIVSWLLTPKGHPAYPSIVKRYIVNRADGASMATETRCFASKATCDKYFGGT